MKQSKLIFLLSRSIDGSFGNCKRRLEAAPSTCICQRISMASDASLAAGLKRHSHSLPRPGIIEVEDSSVLH